MLNHALLGVASGGGYQMENSLLFRGAQYLTRTPTVAGNRKTFTLSLWVRRNRLGAEQMLFSAGASGGRFNLRWWQDGTERLTLDDDLGAIGLTTSQLWRDPTGFLHLVVAVDTPQETAVERVKVYCNGQRITDWSTATYPARYTEFSVNNTVPHLIGRNAPTAVFFMEVELAEPILIDGAALSPDVFGQIDPVTGSWRPKAVSCVDFGTNGVYLGKPWDAADLGGDVSGRGNHWTPVSFVTSDVVSDSPTNVFATLNPLDRVSATLSDGDLHVVTVGNGNTYPGGYACGGVSVSSGKWYFEATGTSIDVSGGNGFAVGFRSASAVIGSSAWVLKTPSVLVYITLLSAGKINDGGTLVDYGAPFTDGDVVGIALDLDAGTLTFTKNGVSQGVAYSGLSGTFRPIVCDYGLSCAADVNFGQRPFAYAPPDGFKALCTANLPATTGQTSGTFTGNAAADGPCVFTGAVPETLSVNGNAVIWGTHADRLATGFKIRTASLTYNASGANSWAVTYDKKPTVGPKGRAPANAQSN